MSQHYFKKLIQQHIEDMPTDVTPIVNMETVSSESLARYIDHTNLKAESTQTDIEVLCQQALQHKFAAVCVHPTWVPLCVDTLAGKNIAICSVVAFPFGATTTENKVLETEELVAMGAGEIDMVLNIGRLKNYEYSLVYDEITQVVDTAQGAVVKVILETCLLNEAEKIAACVLSKEAGAHFVKTSTGTNKAGATVEDVSLMRRVVGSQMGVKAAGGIKSYQTALAMLAAGANRIGSSSGPDLIGNP